MSTDQRASEIIYWCKQECPFCHEDKIVIANGLIRSGEKIELYPDRGYSFCNCKNIWFTDWSNIDLPYYNQSIIEKEHKDSKDYKKGCKEILQHYLRLDKIHNGGYGKNMFLDLGSIAPFTLDEAKRLGFETTGFDMFERKDFGHDLVVGDFEIISLFEPKSFNLIWANHIFEHFHYPLEALKKCYDLLSDNGEIFVAMPDPFFINFENIYTFPHFLLRNHHIMWDMDSFIDEAEKIGFKNTLRYRNTEVNVHEDMHLVFKK